MQLQGLELLEFALGHCVRLRDFDRSGGQSSSVLQENSMDIVLPGVKNTSQRQGVNKSAITR